MATTPTDTPPHPTSPPVINAVPKPKGLLPRHAQTWLLLGLASVIILIVAFTGQSTPPSRTSAVPPPPMAIDPNQSRIQEYRDRIDEQARRLAAEQAELEAAKRALSQSRALPPSQASDAPNENGQESPATDAFEQDRRQREYRSLFADNLALTLREPSAKPTAAAVPALPQPLPSSARALMAGQATAAAPVPLPVPSAPELAPANQPGAPQSLPTPPPPTTSDTPPPAGVSPNTPAPPRASEPPPGSARLLEGTIIESVLTTRLDGTFASPVSCLVTTPVYSRDFQRVLIPRGSRLLGTATPVTQTDQQRLAIAFHRLLLPSGRAVSLERTPALNQIGQAGLRDQVDHHYLSIFGATLAVGALAGLAQVNTSLGYDASWSDTYRQGVAGSVAQSSLHILDRFLNRLPTVTIREGHRVKVYLTGDLDVPLDDSPPSASGGSPIR